PPPLPISNSFHSLHPPSLNHRFRSYQWLKTKNIMSADPHFPHRFFSAAHGILT
ncbi:hypothetical protein LINGRAHAP2_LOCUS18866, partial [Linum grandiflorum]